MTTITFPTDHVARVERAGVHWDVPLLSHEVNGLYAGADALVRASILGRVVLPSAAVINHVRALTAPIARTPSPAFRRCRRHIWTFLGVDPAAGEECRLCGATR